MTMSSSCPKNIITHRFISLLVSVSLVISFFLIKQKVCHIPFMYESEAIEFLATSRPIYTSQHVENYIKYYYKNLQILHCIAFILTNIICVFTFADLIPKHKRKLSFQIFAIVVMILDISIILYLAYNAFHKPCLRSKSDNYIIRREDNLTFNAYTEGDYVMLIITIIHSFSSFLLTCSTILFCTEVTNV